jgi:hypothetical protein
MKSEKLLKFLLNQANSIKFKQEFENPLKLSEFHLQTHINLQMK